ncbi:MAG TPA: YbjN domain-containing protein [Thiotrichales bacterium]|nr:YbjN domain-containing protein [Thiotrichales bacterium]
MSNDLVTPENVTRELLASIYDAAFMEISWDSDGDLKVKDNISCFVLISERKDYIQLLSIFGFEPRTSMGQRLACVNDINLEYIMVTAYAGGNDTFQFKHHIFLDGGITRKNLVMATKRFLSIPISAIQEHGIDLVQ